MKNIGNILDDPKFKTRQFSVPEGYFESVEARVHDRIEASQRRPSLVAILRPAVLMACMFLIIGGIGYGTLKLTGTLEERDHITEQLEANLEGLEFTDEEAATFLETELSPAAFEEMLAVVYHY